MKFKVVLPVSLSARVNHVLGREKKKKKKFISREPVRVYLLTIH